VTIFISMRDHPQQKLRPGDYQALSEFRYQIRRFVHFSEEAARQAGIEPRHHQLMLAIKGAPEGRQPSIGYLAERLQVQHNSAVELLDRLAKKGLVTRIRGGEDRREVHVQLTARGERALEELTLHTRAELRSAIPALVKTLRKITTHTESRRGPRAKVRAVTAGKA
jgi:DNA-binding MarR family transcriptional regulator